LDGNAFLEGEDGFAAGSLYDSIKVARYGYLWYPRNCCHQHWGGWIPSLSVPISRDLLKTVFLLVSTVMHLVVKVTVFWE
jgi:hypothetical protein